MQLSAARKGKPGEPPRRMCDRCKAFLDAAETKEVSCETCSSAIVWPKEHQLKVELGVWAKPTLCAGCRKARGSLVSSPLPAPVSETPESETPTPVDSAAASAEPSTASTN